MINLHHSIDFKLSAVKLYLKMKSIREVANLLDCKKSSLQRWIVRYLETGSIERKENSKRKSIITTDILNFIKDTLSDDDNETYTFYKHSEKDGGKGFTQSRVGWNKFLDMFGGWFPDLDWNKVKEKLNSLPNGQKLLIKKPPSPVGLKYKLN